MENVESHEKADSKDSVLEVFYYFGGLKAIRPLTDFYVTDFVKIWDIASDLVRRNWET